MNKRDCADLAKSSLDFAISHEIAHAISNSNILITGASGFVGRNLVFFLDSLRKRHNTSFKLEVLRRKDTPLGDYRGLVSGEVEWDENNPKFKTQYDFVFHLANDNSDFTKSNFEPEDTASFKMLNFLFRTLRLQGRECNFMLASSGAVYGVKNLNDANDCEFTEEVELKYAELNSYGRGKLYCEEWATRNKPSNINLAICRMFSFYGPYLPTNLNFAAGNFLHDSIAFKRLLVKGSGKSVRSYLSSYDLALALLLVVTRKFSGAINIGGSLGISINDLAQIFCRLTQSSLEVRNDGSASDTYYVPKTRVLNEVLGFNETTNIEEGIQKWLNCVK